MLRTEKDLQDNNKKDIIRNLCEEYYAEKLQMTIEEAKAAIAKTKSPYLKRDLEKFIARQEKKSKRRT